MNEINDIYEDFFQHLIQTAGQEEFQYILGVNAQIAQTDIFGLINNLAPIINFQNNDEENALNQALQISFNYEQPKERRIMSNKEFEILKLNNCIRATKKDLDKTCNICLEQFKLRQNKLRLSCEHEFHPVCLKSWVVRESSSCPLCRNVIEHN